MFIYILRCEGDSLYTGIASDFSKRLRQHTGQLKGGAKYTRSHKVKAVCALWKTDSDSTARRLEISIKRLSKSRKEKLILEPENLTSEYCTGFSPEDVRPVSFEKYIRGSKNMNSYRDDIFKYAEEKYGTKPDFPWGDISDGAVLRHSNNKKWYGLIMEVQYKRLGINKDGAAFILNVKCDPLMIGSLREEQGILPAYHMNRANWVSVLLDGTAELDKVYDLLDMSYNLTAGKSKKRNGGKVNGSK